VSSEGAGSEPVSRAVVIGGATRRGPSPTPTPSGPP
jgi:hypothetical protein